MVDLPLINLRLRDLMFVDRHLVALAIRCHKRCRSAQ